MKAVSQRKWLSVIIYVLAIASMRTQSPTHFQYGCAFTNVLLVFDIAGVIAIRWPGLGGALSLQHPTVKGLLSSWLITGVVADILIAVSLVWHLVGRGHHLLGYALTDQSVRRSVAASLDSRTQTRSWTESYCVCSIRAPKNTSLIPGLAGAVTVQTGVLTTTWAILDLAFYLASVS